MKRSWAYTLALFVCLNNGAWAQAWPTKPVHAIVPWPAGGATDIVARMVAERLSVQLGRPIIVENRVGAGGTIGTAAVAKADPDGHTMLITSSSYVTAAAAFSNLSYDSMRDLSAIIPIGSHPSVLVISPSKGIKSIGELVALAKAKPGSINLASSGYGSAPHLIAERFRLSAGFEAVHVPYKGAPEALTEVMSGRIDIFFSPLLPALPLISDGKLLALAVSSVKRSSALPKVPTTVEAGFPNSEYEFWNGILTSARTPHGIVDKIYQETAKVLRISGVQEKLAELGNEPMLMTQAEFDAQVKREIALNLALAKAIGLRMD